MELTNETLHTIQTTAVQASDCPLLLDAPKERVYWNRSDSCLVHVPVPPALHDHCVASIGDLLSALNCLDREGKQSAVFCEGRRLVLILDLEDRRDRVTMPLEFSDAFRLVIATAPPREDLALLRPRQDSIFQQRPLVAWLRALGDAVRPADLLVKVRTLAFERGQRTTAEVAHQRESLGRAVEAAVVASQGDLPEDFVVNCPIYPGEEMRQLSAVSIRMRLSVVHEQEAFLVAPMPGEIDDAMDVVGQRISSRVREEFPEEVAVVRGVCG